MSSPEDTTYTDLVYQKLTDVEKAHYHALNRKIKLMRFHQVLFMIVMLTIVFVMLKINVLIAACASLMYLFASDSLNNEVIRAKVNRILFERTVGLERKQVEHIRRESRRKPTK